MKYKIDDLVKHDNYVGVITKVLPKNNKYDYEIEFVPFGLHKMWEEDLRFDDGED